MKKVNLMTTALFGGFLLGGLHLLWALLVLVGWAQMLLDFVFSLHFLDNPYFVNEFDLGRAIMLVVVTFGVGYFVGWVSGVLWNMLGAGKK